VSRAPHITAAMHRTESLSESSGRAFVRIDSLLRRHPECEFCIQVHVCLELDTGEAAAFEITQC
jgi:hypothetical protein